MYSHFYNISLSLKQLVVISYSSKVLHCYYLILLQVDKCTPEYSNEADLGDSNKVTWLVSGPFLFY